LSFFIEIAGFVFAGRELDESDGFRRRVGGKIDFFALRANYAGINLVFAGLAQPAGAGLKYVG